jgi:TrpR family trp operon transcriptional repressor
MKNWKSFIQLCLKAQDAETLSKLFDFFLTIEEKSVITDRFLIIKALMEGRQTQRDIASTLGVSIAKITRGSNALKSIDPKLKSFLEKCH